MVVRSACRLRYALSLLFCCLVAAGCVSHRATAAATAAAGPPLTVQGGQVSGSRADNGVWVYKGIPYAAPPVGKNRWRPPQPVVPWQGVRVCDRYGPACPQPRVSWIFRRKYEAVSEDCLYLNVWTPVAPAAAATPLPVMVWIHGGGFMTGSASDDFYDGRFLAAKGAVVVTCNYRLGVFGFLAHPLLSRESAHGVSGNYGLLDLVQVLRWVQDNIKAFGGDPDRVTIFGESAGGRAVAFLMVSPLARGLFHRAVMQSSAAYRPIQHLRQSWYGRSPMEKVGERLLARLGLDKTGDPLAALRATATDDILEAARSRLPGMKAKEEEGVPYEPIVDGWVLPDDPGDLFDQGRFAPVPVIVGSTANESSLFTAPLRRASAAKLRDLLRETFPDFHDRLESRFRLDDRDQAFQAMNRILDDLNSLGPMRRIAANVARRGGRAYRYYFTRVRRDFLGRRFGAWHGSEVRFVFDSLEEAFKGPDDTDRRVATAMSRYWVNFAANGDPNGPGLVPWPPCDANGEPTLEIGDTITVRTGLHADTLDLMEEIEGSRRRGRLGKTAP